MFLPRIQIAPVRDVSKIYIMRCSRFTVDVCLLNDVIILLYSRINYSPVITSRPDNIYIFFSYRHLLYLAILLHLYAQRFA